MLKKILKKKKIATKRITFQTQSWPTYKVNAFVLTGLNCNSTKRKVMGEWDENKQLWVQPQPYPNKQTNNPKGQDNSSPWPCRSLLLFTCHGPDLSYLFAHRHHSRCADLSDTLHTAGSFPWSGFCADYQNSPSAPSFHFYTTGPVPKFRSQFESVVSQKAALKQASHSVDLFLFFF